MAEYGLTTAVKLSSNEMPDQALPAVAAVLGEAYARMQRMNRALMAAGLVDRVQVTLFPVITGQTGVDPIFQYAADFDLELIESRTLDGHTQELIYRPILHG